MVYVLYLNIYMFYFFDWNILKKNWLYYFGFDLYYVILLNYGIFDKRGIWYGIFYKNI